MPKMKSLITHPYGGRTYEVGEEFDADPRLVQILTALGRARVVSVTARALVTRPARGKPS